MARKLRVGVVFGGRSGEHEISLLSAASVLKAIDPGKYEVVPIGITKQGRWVSSGDAELLLNGKLDMGRPLRAGDPSTTAPAAVLAGGKQIVAAPTPASLAERAAAVTPPADVLNLDVVFPVLHGTFGEDGTIQGLFELAELPYVGSGVLGSAAGMDKDVMKRLFLAARLPIVRHTVLLRGDWRLHPRKATAGIEAQLRYPMFVKPANLGSSVGISKVHDRRELGPAMQAAAGYDRKIVVEEAVGSRGRKKERARELEVAVLGNDHPAASVVGEVIPAREFYDYEAKYVSEDSLLIIPARIPAAQSRKVREMAIAAFRACDCAGLARVDFLLEPGAKGRLYLNEVNTMPGFTSISMYPKLWEASGLGYRDLISKLIELALERAREKTETSYTRAPQASERDGVPLQSNA